MNKAEKNGWVNSIVRDEHGRDITIKPTRAIMAECLELAGMARYAVYDEIRTNTQWTSKWGYRKCINAWKNDFRININLAKFHKGYSKKLP